MASSVIKYDAIQYAKKFFSNSRDNVTMESSSPHVGFSAQDDMLTIRMQSATTDGVNVRLYFDASQGLFQKYTSSDGWITLKKIY